MRGWRLLGLIALGVIILVMTLAGWWLADDRELRAMEVELETVGVGGGSPYPAPATRDDAWWDELIADLPEVRASGHPTHLSGLPASWTPTPLNRPLPAEVAAHQATIGDDVADLIVARLSALQGDDVPPQRVADRIRVLREFLIERILVAPPGRLPRLVDVASRAVGTATIDATALIEAVGWRIDDCVRGRVGGAPLIALAQRMPAALLSEMRWSAVLSLARYHDVDREEPYLPHRWLWRYARPAVIREWRACLALARDDDLPAMLASTRSMPAGSSFTDCALLAHRVVDISVREYVYHHAFAVVGARALAAVLDGGDLPIDPFDASGAVVRRRTASDGAQTIYSVGFDGRDDGGTAHDLRFAVLRAGAP